MHTVGITFEYILVMNCMRGYRKRVVHHASVFFPLSFSDIFSEKVNNLELCV